MTVVPVPSPAPLSAPLVIAIKKKTDGSASLACRRADGTVTWQRQEGAQGRFFPRHDLTHYAVETVLGMGLQGADVAGRLYREVLESLNDYVAEHGIPLQEHRQF